MKTAWMMLYILNTCQSINFFFISRWDMPKTQMGPQNVQRDDNKGSIMVDS